MAQQQGFRRLGAMMAAALAVLVMAACQPIYRNHGYIPTDQELASVEVGVSTREDVAALVGRPTASGVLAESGWFYVGSRFKHYGARAPEEVDRQVVAISFSPEGVVQNVERFGMERGRVVALSRRVTESNIKPMSLITQIFANFGRVTAGQLLK